MSQQSVTDCDSELDALGSPEEDDMLNSPLNAGSDIGEMELQGSPPDEYRLHSKDDISKNTLVSIHKLQSTVNNLNDFSMKQNERTMEELQVYSADILYFIKAVAERQLVGNEDQNYTQCIVSLFDLEFLSTLIELRKMFIRLASAEIDISVCEETVVCWVDFFFACCTDFISSVAGASRFNLGSARDSLPMGLQSQKQEDNIRIACQLPHALDQFPALLSSRYASPALKRLSLNILFAALVLRADLEDCDPWDEDDRIDPSAVLECLLVLIDEFVAQALELNLSEKGPTSYTLRTAYAMAIALFASAEAAKQRKEKNAMTPFQPHTRASLLELMYLVLQPSQSSPIRALPLGEIDDSHAVLLLWGNTVPWAWDKWDDPRVSDSDTVIMLTANWLCHVEKSFSIALWEEVPYGLAGESAPMISGDLAQVLRDTMKLNPGASLAALFHQIRDEAFRGIPSNEEHDDSNFLRLYRTTWCLVELITACENTLASDSLCLTAEQLLMLFVELNKSSGEMASRVKGEIIRCLDTLKPNIVEKVFLSFHKDITFFSKVIGAIAKASRMIGDPAGHFLLAPGVVEGIIALLDFISLICKRNAIKCIPVTTFSFLSDLVKFLGTRFGTVEMRTALLRCLMHAYAQCQSAGSGGEVRARNKGSKEGSPAVRPHKTWDDEDAYNLALNVTGTNLELAASFATYVSLTIKKSTDPLLTAEAFDYLRDVILILSSRRLDEHDNECDPFPDTASSEARTLKCVSALEKICAALETMLKRSDEGIARFLLGSPYTRSLYDSLHEITQSASPVVTASQTVAEDNVGLQNTEEAVPFDPRVAKTCKKFLEKLKTIEADLKKKES